MYEPDPVQRGEFIYSFTLQYEDGRQVLVTEPLTILYLDKSHIDVILNVNSCVLSA